VSDMKTLIPGGGLCRPIAREALWLRPLIPEPDKKKIFIKLY